MNIKSFSRIIHLIGLFFITALIASCGGGSSTTTTSTTTTVINGISVPPEPDPKINNATIAGIDSNNNGLRDDVEIAMASTKGYVPARDNDIAKTYLQLINDNKLNSTEIGNLIKKINCNYINNPSSIDVQNVIINTQEREEAFAEKLYSALSAKTISATVNNSDRCK
jgi:hypothetical protein